GNVSAGPRTVDAWLIPEVSAVTPTVVPNALGLPAVPVVPVTTPPLTLAGTGDLGWAAYYDNVAERLGIYDPLTGVTGAVSYLVVGWFAATGTEPLAAVTSGDAFDTYLANRHWSLPGGVKGSSGPVPTRTICHGAVL